MINKNNFLQEQSKNVCSPSMEIRLVIFPMWPNLWLEKTFIWAAVIMRWIIHLLVQTNKRKCFHQTNANIFQPLKFIFCTRSGFNFEKIKIRIERWKTIFEALLSHEWTGSYPFSATKEQDYLKHHQFMCKHSFAYIFIKLVAKNIRYHCDEREKMSILANKYSYLNGSSALEMESNQGAIEATASF